MEKNLRMLAFVRPALQAAVELGRLELRESLSRGLSEDADYLVSALTELRAGPSPEGSANVIRRTILGLALDEHVTEDDARAQLYWLFDRLLPGRRRASAPSSP